jgi:hypothetical protein
MQIFSQRVAAAKAFPDRKVLLRDGYLAVSRRSRFVSNGQSSSQSILQVEDTPMTADDGTYVRAAIRSFGQLPLAQ